VPTHTIGVTFKTDAGSVPISATAFNLKSEVNAALPVAAGQTVTFTDVQFPAASINDYVVSLLSATGKTEAATGSATLNWNGGNGNPQMLMVAKQPISHWPGSGSTNLFSADISSLTVINTGTADLVIGIHIGLN